MSRAFATALLVAAGSGERLGAGRPKALVTVAGRPMYEWSLRAFAASRTVDRAVIAVPSAATEEVTKQCGTDHTEVISGGGARSESVLAALERAESEVVVVHDAARPLLSPDLIDAVVARLTAEPLECGGVIAATPVSDTIKRAAPPEVEGGAPTVVETLDRTNLWAVQTPQAFRSSTLRMALESVDDLATATDDAMLVERLGRRVAIHPSSPLNLKVTSPADLEIAERLLRDPSK